MELISDLFTWLGQWFDLILTFVVIITGVTAIIDVIYFARRRIRFFNKAIGRSDDLKEPDERQSFFKSVISTIPRALSALVVMTLALLLWKKDWYCKRLLKNETDLDANVVDSHKDMLNPPMLVEWCRSFFPVLFLVLIIRAFLYSPYVVPTGSLEPTILPGDFLVSNKFDYGLRWPVTRVKFVNVGEPKTGDIVIFKVPVNTKIDYIKRTIGVPGDTISYINKVVYINGKEAKQTYLGKAWEVGAKDQRQAQMDVYEEDLNGVKHKIFRNPKVPAHNFYNIKVPKGNYFMMGDNRDDSADSRYWGFMPEENIIGKAQMIFFSKVPGHFSFRWSRIGTYL